MECGDKAKTEAADGEPDARGQLLEEDVGGDLEEDVGDEEDGQDRVELGALELQVVDEVEGFGVADIDAVEKGEQVQDADEGDDVHINAPQNLGLGRVGRADDGGRVGGLLDAELLVVAAGGARRRGVGDDALVGQSRFLFVGGRHGGGCGV